MLVWLEEQGKDVAATKITEWFFEPESFLPLARKQGTELHYVVCDHLGTPRELFCEDGRLHWAEDCFPALEYIKRHGQQQKIGDLARTVHASHLVELGPLTEADSESIEETLSFKDALLALNYSYYD